MSTPLRFVQLTDLHLSDLEGTASAKVLAWTIEKIGQIRPDFVAFSGDATTYGTVPSLAAFHRQMERVSCPVLITPGNAELRSGQSDWVAANWASRRRLDFGNSVALLPDTSTGSLPAKERSWLQSEVRNSDDSVLLITHYPIDSLDKDSRGWLLEWMENVDVELYVAGHIHRDRIRSVGRTKELVTRGLDPDKAIGGPPALTECIRDSEGKWTECTHAWDPELELNKAGTLPVECLAGWSYPGDPVEALASTAEIGLSALELRPDTASPSETVPTTYSKSSSA